jgi:hypothetical protein
MSENLQVSPSRELGRSFGRRVASGSEIAEIAFVKLSQDGKFDDVTVFEHAEIFTLWVIGAYYAEKTIVRHEGGLYRCVQSHTSQSDWAPSAASALWSPIGDPQEEFPPWSQPIGASDAYALGAKTTYDGRHWTSTAANNVWIPGVYGWEEVL